MELNMRYYNGEADDALPYVGELKTDAETGYVYDKDMDAVDAKTVAAFCECAGKGDDEDE